MQALEKSVEAGGALDQYEIEGPDRAELLQDLAEFQLAAVGSLLPSCCTQLPFGGEGIEAFESLLSPPSSGLSSSSRRL